MFITESHKKNRFEFNFATVDCPDRQADWQPLMAVKVCALLAANRNIALSTAARATEV